MIKFLRLFAFDVQVYVLAFAARYMRQPPCTLPTDTLAHHTDY